jgi:hypothetical protein
MQLPRFAVVNRRERFRFPRRVPKVMRGGAAKLARGTFISRGISLGEDN